MPIGYFNTFKQTTTTKDLVEIESLSKRKVRTKRVLQYILLYIQQQATTMFQLTVVPTILQIFLIMTMVMTLVASFTTTPSTLLSTSVSSYSPPTTSTTLLPMVPKYVGNQWVPQTEDDLPSAGYDVFGTFVRHGPKPTLTRITSPNDYEQAILKFMVTDQCNYITAQGNMDAYLRNPPDWQYQRMEDMKNGYERQRDYVTIQVKDIILVLTWSAIVVAVVGRVIYSVTNGVDFVSLSLFMCVCLLSVCELYECVCMSWAMCLCNNTI